MASQKVAVVTGSNKGIGFAIVKALAKDYKGVVYLTGLWKLFSLLIQNQIFDRGSITNGYKSTQKARNTELGLQAIAELEKQGLKANFHQLDIDNVKSIQTLAKYLKEKYGGLDLLVNNAAIAYKAADTTPFKDQASHTIRVNFTATLDMCNAMFPLLRPHARVVRTLESTCSCIFYFDFNLIKVWFNSNIWRLTLPVVQECWNFARTNRWEIN